jgi:hypothetical protein
VAEPVQALAPGAYWREVLADAVDARDAWWTLGDLLREVANCNVGLVDVAGWLTDELVMERMRPVESWPRCYERVPGVILVRSRDRRRGG